VIKVMRKRNLKSPKAKKTSVEVPKSKPEETNLGEEQENKMNFGGLPMRDLKRNLGCG